jgi:hypothetical protein
MYFMNSKSPSIPTNELIVAKLEALLAECDLITDHPQLLDEMELFFLEKGRKFLQETFQEKLQERIKKVETTAEAQQCPYCKKNVPVHGIFLFYFEIGLLSMGEKE